MQGCGIKYVRWHIFKMKDAPNKSEVWVSQVWRQRRGADAASMLCIVAVFAVCFGPTLLSGKAILLVDSLCYSYPLRSVAWQQIRQGSLPLWTSLIFSGYPLLSMGQLSLGYPLTWGYLFLPGAWAEQVYVLSPFLCAPAFLYAYIRQLGLSRIAALLAGLGFAYSGLNTNVLGHNGWTPNAVMWLPLLLICIERARTRPLATCVLWGGLAYAMSVLNGYGQGFLYVGIIAVAYAFFLCLATPRAHTAHDGERSGWIAAARWRPLLAAVCAVIAGAGVAAFQVLESMRAVRLSIRSALSFELFNSGFFTPQTSFKSLLFPAYYELEVTSYMPLLAIVLATAAGIVAIRRRDARVFFWLATALIAWALMLGEYTPLSRLLYHVPLVNLFRRPARHVFEWAFAVAVLSAYGWDALSAWGARQPVRSPRLTLAMSLTTLVLAALVGAVWWAQLDAAPFPNHALNQGVVQTSYAVWKITFTILTCVSIWAGWRSGKDRWRAGTLVGAVLLTCFMEPFILLSAWWLPWARPADQFAVPSVAVRFLQNYDPAQYRAYQRVDLFADQFAERPRVDAPNLSMLHGIHNVAGYEPLILERYSRALGNVAMDGFNPRPGFPSDLSIFGNNSHVLDLLNTKFFVSFSDFSAAPITRLEREGISFSGVERAQHIEAGRKVLMAGRSAQGDTLAIVSSMANSSSVADGEVVAKLRVLTSDGQTLERELRAGTDTADWAYEQPDMQRSVLHRRVPVFDSWPGDVLGTFTAHRYRARLPLGKRAAVAQVEIENVTYDVTLTLWKATVFDSETRRSTTLAHAGTRLPVELSPDQWQTVYDADDILILRNERALPRAWLVAEAEAVDGEEALRRIRGESEREFDPRRTALLEVAPHELPALPGGLVGSNATAQVSYRPNGVLVDTYADTAALLVFSETNYPGWTATVDGIAQPIYATDYLLRSVPVPSGTHRVEMKYAAPAARNGAWISLSTLLLITSLPLLARRSRTAPRAIR
jgi:hypothetical protein